MDRREFVKICTVALATATVTSALPVIAAEEGKKPTLDPDKFAETAYQHFIPGKLTCCESILIVGCEALGVKSDLVPDITLGLAGGVGFQGEICGVITGSALVLSLAISKKETEYPKKKMGTLSAVGRLHNAFKEQFGCTDCRSLCGLDLTTLEGRKKLEASVKAQTCANYVKVGARLLAQELQNI